MAVEQEEVKLVLEAIAKGLGDIATLAGELKKSGDAADKSQEQLSQYDKAVAGVEKGIGDLKASVGGLAAAFLSVETVRFITDQIKLAAETQRVAQSLGLTTESLSTYQAILSQFGIAQDATNEAMATFTEKLYEAAEGGADAQELFGALGVTVTDNNGKLKSSEQVLRELAGAFQTPGNEAVKTAASIGIFGDELGLKMIPVLSQGTEGLDKMAAAAKANGEVLTEEQAEAAKKAAAELTRLGNEVMAIAREISITLTPAFGIAVTLTKDFIDVTTFLGKSLGNLFAAITTLDFSSYQENQKALFDDLTKGIADNHKEVKKAGDEIEQTGEKAKIASKATEEFGWNMTIAGRAASDLSGTLDEILTKPLSANSAVQLALSLEVAGKQAGNTARIISDTLTEALSKLSGDQLAQFRVATEQAFAAGRISAEQYQTLLNKISQGALAKLGVDLEKLKIGMTAAEQEAIKLFAAVANAGTTSSEALKAGLLQTLQAIETPAGLANLTNQFRTLQDQGKITGTDLATLVPIFASIDSAIAGGLEPGSAFEALLARLKTAGQQTADGIAVLDQAFQTLGKTAPGALADTADAARAAFAAIAAGDTTLQQQQAAFLAYAEAALRAAEAAGSPAPKLLEQQAAALGLSTAYQELQQQSQAVSAEFDAITASLDRQAAASAAQAATVTATAEAQAALSSAVTSTAIALGEESQAAQAAVVAMDARIVALQSEAAAQQQVAESARQKLIALEDEIAAGAQISIAQEQQLLLLREEVTQKTAAAEAAARLAAVVQTETEATGRFAAALDAALAAIRAALDPQLQLTDAKVKAAEAALQAAEATQNETDITTALGTLRETQIEQARVLVAVRQAEAAAAREAADAAILQATADGQLTTTEQESIRSAETLVQAKQQLAAAAVSTTQALEQQTAASTRATGAATQQSQAMGGLVIVQQQETAGIKQQAAEYEKLTAAAQRAYQARLQSLSSIPDTYRQTAAISAYVAEINASTRAELDWAEATQNTIARLRNVGISSADARQQIQLLGYQALQMGDLMTEAGQAASDALRSIQQEAADALQSMREFIAEANDDLAAQEQLRNEQNLQRIREYAAVSDEARALLDEAEAAEAARHERALQRIKEETGAKRELAAIPTYTPSEPSSPGSQAASYGPLNSAIQRVSNSLNQLADSFIKFAQILGRINSTDFEDLQAVLSQLESVKEVGRNGA